MRKALIVGIDHYSHISRLHGCVNDAYAVKSMLERNADGTINFGCRLMVATSTSDSITRTELKNSIRSLFAETGEVAVLYFAGHGHAEDTGGYLCATDSGSGDDGVPLSEVLTFANSSNFHNKIIILDSCYSGAAAARPLQKSISEISDGVTILTASTDTQYANEINGSGVFTTLLVDALGGAAANLVGDITPGSVYAHIDQSLGSWAQRPVFKTNVRKFVSLRRVSPPISLADLQRITEFFPEPGSELVLDPSYEPERSGSEDSDVPPPDEAKTAVFSVLQKYNRLNLLVPDDAPHMWHAAMQSKAVRLTALGEHYRRLVAENLL
jgi:hypothetical protein